MMKSMQCVDGVGHTDEVTQIDITFPVVSRKKSCHLFSIYCPPRPQAEHLHMCKMWGSRSGGCEEFYNYVVRHFGGISPLKRLSTCIPEDITLHIYRYKLWSSSMLSFRLPLQIKTVESSMKNEARETFFQTCNCEGEFT
jgi:hypothetical protein